jgi:hypothetical protein
VGCRVPKNVHKLSWFRPLSGLFLQEKAQLEGARPKKKPRQGLRCIPRLPRRPVPARRHGSRLVGQPQCGCDVPKLLWRPGALHGGCGVTPSLTGMGEGTPVPADWPTLLHV